MTIQKRTFRYQIMHVSAENGTFEVCYMPEQSGLSDVYRNLVVTGAGIEADIEASAPYDLWYSQEQLASMNLAGQSGVITPPG